MSKNSAGSRAPGVEETFCIDRRAVKVACCYCLDGDLVVNEVVDGKRDHKVEIVAKAKLTVASIAERENASIFTQTQAMAPSTLHLNHLDVFQRYDGSRDEGGFAHAVSELTMRAHAPAERSSICSYCQRMSSKGVYVDVGDRFVLSCFGG